MSETLLKISDLCVDFETEQGALNVLDHVSFEIRAGKTLGLVGESTIWRHETTRYDCHGTSVQARPTHCR